MSAFPGEALGKYTRKCYNAYMSKPVYANFRANKEDIALLKEIAAIRRQSMLDVFGLLVKHEYERLQVQRQRNPLSVSDPVDNREPL